MEFCVILSGHEDLKNNVRVKTYIGIIYVLYSFFANAALPLSYEMMVEAIYPVPEGLSNSFATCLCNIFIIILLIIPL